MYGSGITLAALSPLEKTSSKPERRSPAPSIAPSTAPSIAPSIVESVQSDNTSSTSRRTRGRFWSRKGKGKAKASNHGIDLVEESSNSAFQAALASDEVICIAPMEYPLEEKQDFSHNISSRSKSSKSSGSRSWSNREKGAFPEGSLSEHTPASISQEKLIVTREQATSSPASSSANRMDPSPKRLLSSAELQFIQKLAEQHVPPDALATVINSMASAGIPNQPQPQQRRPLDTYQEAPPAYY